MNKNNEKAAAVSKIVIGGILIVAGKVLVEKGRKELNKLLS